MVAISCAHAAHEADAVLHAHSVTWAAVSGDGLAVGEEGALRIAHAKRGHAQQLEARGVEPDQLRLVGPQPAEVRQRPQR